MMKLVARRKPNQPRIVRLMSTPQKTVAGLTTTEVDVLLWLSHGKHFNEIAAIMGLSTNSVVQHSQRMRMKLGANSAAGAVALALRRNIIE